MPLPCTPRPQYRPPMIMDQRLLRFAAGAALLAACSSNPPPRSTSRPDTPAAAPGAGPARVLMAMSYTSTAILERNDSIILALPSGGRQVQRLSRRARFTVNVTDRGEVRVRLDSLVFRPSAGGSERGAVGATWTGRLTTAGLSEVRSDRRSAVVAEMTQAVRDLFPALPRSGVATGDNWSDTTRGRRQVEIFEANDERVARWSVGRRSTRSGILVLPVTASESYTQLGEGEQAGRSMRMSSEGRRTSTYYLAMSGRTDAIVQVDSATRLITIPSTRQAIPTTQVIRTRVGWDYK
jgi:hypothetical protein